MTTQTHPGQTGTSAGSPRDDRDSRRQPAPVWRRGWLALAVTTLGRAALVALATLLLWSVLPAALGWHTTVVMSGSMAPRLQTGDVVASRPIAASTPIHPGQVLLVNDPDHAGRLRLHRLAAIRPDGMLTLRGDANRGNDSTPVSRTAVQGLGSLRVPVVAKPVYWLQTGGTLPLALAGVGLLALAGAAFLYRDDTEIDSQDDENQPSGPPDDSDPWTIDTLTDADHDETGRHRTRSLVLTFVAVVAATGLGLASPAVAAPFKGTSANAANAWSAERYFSCASAGLTASTELLYPLDDTSGTTATDGSSKGRNGKYVGGYTLGAAGPCPPDSKGVTLNGWTGGVSTTTPFTNPTVFSLEIWFKTTTTRGGELIGFGDRMDASSPNNDRHLYLDRAGHVVFGVYPGTVKTVASAKTYRDGGWHLATATLSSAGMQLYVDGVSVASDARVTTAQDYTGYWHVGFNRIVNWTANPTSGYLAGTIANVAVYSSALSADDVAAHYAVRS